MGGKLKSIWVVLMFIVLVIGGCGGNNSKQSVENSQKESNVTTVRQKLNTPYTVEEMKQELAAADEYLAQHPNNPNWILRKKLLEEHIRNNAPISDNELTRIILEAKDRREKEENERRDAERKAQEIALKKAEQEKAQVNSEKEAVLTFCHARNQLLEILDGKLNRAQGYVSSDKQRYINDSYNALIEAQNTLQNIGIPQVSKGEASYNMERCLHFLESSIKWRLQLLKAAQHYLDGNVTQEDYLATQTVPGLVRGDLLNSLDFLVKAASLYGISRQEALNN